eukprot:gene14601-14724_t
MQNADLRTASFVEMGEINMLLLGVTLPVVLIALAVGYALGSIPFGVIVTRLAGIGDVRNIGSGNIGATNVLRTGRKDLAAATLIGDTGKAMLAVVIVRSLYGEQAGAIAGAAAFLGHLFPVWLGFKGGKGVATFFGVMLTIHWEIGVIAGATWIFTAAVFRMSSLAALVAVALTPVYMLALGQPPAFLIASLFMGVLIYYRHLANIQHPLTGLNAQERRDRLRLARTDQVGAVTFHALLSRFRSAERALEALPGLSLRGGRTHPLRPISAEDADRELRSGAQLGARMIVFGDRDYPKALGVADPAPPVLWVQGAILCEGLEDIARELARPRPIAEPESELFGEGPLDEEALARISDQLRHRLLELISVTPVSRDELVRASGAPAGAVLAVLVELQLAGRLELLPGGLIEITLTGRKLGQSLKHFMDIGQDILRWSVDIRTWTNAICKVAVGRSRAY